MLIEQQSAAGQPVSRFDDIVEKLDKVRMLLGDDGHRDHALQVMDGLEPLVKSRLKDFSLAELNALVVHVNLVIQRLASLSPEVRARSDSDRILQSLRRALSGLLSANPGARVA